MKSIVNWQTKCFSLCIVLSCTQMWADNLIHWYLYPILYHHTWISHVLTFLVLKLNNIQVFLSTIHFIITSTSQHPSQHLLFWSIVLSTSWGRFECSALENYIFYNCIWNERDPGYLCKRHGGKFSGNRTSNTKVSTVFLDVLSRLPLKLIPSLISSNCFLPFAWPGSCSTELKISAGSVLAVACMGGGNVLVKSVSFVPAVEIFMTGNVPHLTRPMT